MHLWLFTCRHKPRKRLKNSHRYFWQCCTTMASLEGIETRTKFGPASFMSPNTLGKHLLHPQTAAENMHLVTQVLNSASPLPCPLPPRSPLLPAVLTNASLILFTAACSSGAMYWYLDSLQPFLRVSRGKAAPRLTPSTSTSSGVKLRHILSTRARRSAMDYSG